MAQRLHSTADWCHGCAGGLLASEERQMLEDTIRAVAEEKKVPVEKAWEAYYKLLAEKIRR